MKLQMNKNSIFAVLLRSPWWLSVGLAAGIYAATRAVLPADYGLYGLFAALPFMVIAVYTAWQQVRAPSEESIAARMDALRALSWAEFSAGIEEAYRREGHTVVASGTAGADFELARAGRVALLGCKRWKVARTGIEPLRELDAARRSRDAHECIYVAAGEITDKARAFASERNIRLVHGAELAILFGKLPVVQKT